MGSGKAQIGFVVDEIKTLVSMATESPDWENCFPISRLFLV